MTGPSLLLLLLFLGCLASIHGWSMVQPKTRPPPPKPKGCVKELQKDVEFDGKFVRMRYAADGEHCQQLCTEHAECQFFSYYGKQTNRVTFGCYMMQSNSNSYIGEPTSTKPFAAVTSGYSLKSCAAKPEFNRAKVYTDVLFYGGRNTPGGQYRSLFTPNYKECQRACTHDPNCQYFTWKNEKFEPKEERYDCSLSFTVTVPQPTLSRKPGYFSGFSQKVQVSTNQYFVSACETKVFEKAVILGEKFDHLLANDFEQCSALCASYPQCTHFTFDGRNCELKKNLKEIVTRFDRRDRSGLPSRHCQQDTTWLSVIHADTEYKIFLSKHLKHIKDVKNPKACQDICIGDFNCQLFTFNNGNCYLMRDITGPHPKLAVPKENTVSGFTLKKHAWI